MDLKRLRYFLAVASERSFTKAARTLNMAQPPLSQRIRELEIELGAVLFDREAKPLALTAAGRLFYEQSVQAVQRIDQIHSTMKQFIGSKRPRFVMGLVPSGFHENLPAFIRRYNELAPDIDLSIREMASYEQIEALKDGRIDVGFGRVRIDDAGITREVLREEPMILALPPDQTLVDMGKPVDLSLLATTPMIVYPNDPRPSYADHLLSLFLDCGVTLTKTLEVRELHTALIMVAAGMGACIVPESARQLAHPDVLFHSLPENTTSPIILCWRSDDVSRGLLTLFATFDDIYPKLGFPVPATIRDRLKS